MLTTLFICALNLSTKTGYAQEVYQHISHTDIYDFLDELANAQVITINSAVKPFSRMLIAEKLQEAEGKTDQLNSRQKKELAFYLRDYHKELVPGKSADKRLDLFYYKDTLFTLSVNPIFGFSLYANDT
ncbi:MAG: hypothetical protein NT126_00420, partial [Bacteroidetes bacterium]|nr:hypothetical protein [Bacteroidota bacterium]